MVNLGPFLGYMTLPNVRYGNERSDTLYARYDNEWSKYLRARYVNEHSESLFAYHGMPSAGTRIRSHRIQKC